MDAHTKKLTALELARKHRAIATAALDATYEAYGFGKEMTAACAAYDAAGVALDALLSHDQAPQ